MLRRRRQEADDLCTRPAFLNFVSVIAHSHTVRRVAEAPACQRMGINVNVLAEDGRSRRASGSRAAVESSTEVSNRVNRRVISNT